MAHTTLTSTVVEDRSAGVVRVLRADARRNRQAVLEAAKRLFAEQGLEAQMPDVAKAANVGVGTVYRHFPTKDHLVAAMAAEYFDRLADEVRRQLEEPEAWDAFCEVIRFAVQSQADDRGLCEVMGLRGDVMDAAARAAGLPELIDELVKRAQRSGELRSDLGWEDVPLIVCGLGRVTQSPPPPSVGRWPRLLEIILDGLRTPAAGTLPKPL